MPSSTPDDDGHDGRQEPDEHRDPRPVDGQVEDVAAEVVGAQEVRRRGRLEAIAGRRGHRLERPHEQDRGEGQDREEEDDADADEALRPAQEATPEVAPAGQRAAPTDSCAVEPGVTTAGGALTPSPAGSRKP